MVRLIRVIVVVLVGPVALFSASTGVRCVAKCLMWLAISTTPTQAQMDAATKWATGQYHRLATVQDMKDCLASGYNFRIGFTVYQSFEDIGSDGIWTPNKAENVLGGHEVCCIGYDDRVNGGSFEVRNSWGESWGDSGNFWMRYVDAADSDILMDGWCQHLGVWK